MATGASVLIVATPLRRPVLVAPSVAAEVVDNPGRSRGLLAEECEGVGLQRHQSAALGEDLVLVEHALREAGHKDLPDPALCPQAHWMAAPVPAVEIADEADAHRVRCPHGEADAGDALHRHRVRAQLLVEAQVPSLGDQVDVHLAQDGREAVGVVDAPLGSVRFDEQAIRKPPARMINPAREQPLAVNERKLAHDVVRRGTRHADAARSREEGSHDHATRPVLVHTEEREGIAVGRGDDARDVILDLLWRHAHCSSPLLQAGLQVSRDLAFGIPRATHSREHEKERARRRLRYVRSTPQPPLIIPDARYFSMPSAVVGSADRRKSARNCTPCVRSLTQRPLACTNSPAPIAAAWPTTVIRSRWPRAFTRRTQKPLSSLWKVTRSTR